MKLGLLQKDVAQRIGTTEQTITNWEMTGHEPQIKYYPKIIEFLGFFPWEINASTLGGKIKKYRYMHGLTQSALARRLGIDHGTLIDCEGNKTKPRRRILEKLEPVLVTA
ncbi:hypothetical protein A4R26_23330 [Niastella populi]|uniref:HTH cro/C1-type domain-containing protein n=1 Tax=Niastella populi TaxID=550983 RepID=A0A1V9FHT0_9BACT|nr:hypothetical protein A4R26_23330 [Niastella populi]